MKVTIKNKFSLRGSSSVKDERGQDAYFVKGKLVSPTKKKFVCGADGGTLYTVRNKWFNVFSHSAYVYDADKNKIARVKHPMFSVKKFIVQGYEDEICVNGDFFSMSSEITRNGKVIGTITRDFTVMLDSFCLEADEKDIPFLIALVIAIDNICDNIRNS